MVGARGVWGRNEGLTYCNRLIRIKNMYSLESAIMMFV